MFLLSFTNTFLVANSKVNALLPNYSVEKDICVRNCYTKTGNCFCEKKIPDLLQCKEDVICFTFHLAMATTTSINRNAGKQYLNYNY